MRQSFDFWEFNFKGMEIRNKRDFAVLIDDLHSGAERGGMGREQDGDFPVLIDKTRGIIGLDGEEWDSGVFGQCRQRNVGMCVAGADGTADSCAARRPNHGSPY